MNKSKFKPKSEGVYQSPDGKKWLVVVKNRNSHGGRLFSTHSQHETKEEADEMFKNLKEK